MNAKMTRYVLLQQETRRGGGTVRLKQGKGDGFTLNVQTRFLFHDKERLFDFEVGVKIVPP